MYAWTGVHSLKNACQGPAARPGSAVPAALSVAAEGLTGCNPFF